MNEFPGNRQNITRRQSRRRLALSMLVSAAILSVALLLIPISLTFDDLLPDRPILDIQFAGEIAAEEPLAEPTEPPEPVVEEMSEDESIAETGPVEEAAEAESEPVDEQSIDWYELLETFAKRSEEFAEQPVPSMSPHFDELRKIAATRYSKPNTREPRPIWENTELDQLGRTVLRSGGCYRVIADPSATRQWEFENFTQYITFCEGTFGRAPPVELPWVEDIVAMYDYLEDRRKLEGY